MALNYPPIGTHLTAYPSVSSSWVTTQEGPNGEDAYYRDVYKGVLISGEHYGAFYMDGEDVEFQGLKDNLVVLRNPDEQVVFGISREQFESDFGDSLKEYQNQLIGEYDYENQRLRPGLTEQGFIYKDLATFEHKSEEICYIPEYDFHEIDSDNTGWYSISDLQENYLGYTYKDVVADCAGDAFVAEKVFEAIDWQSPNTLFNELDEYDWAAFEVERFALSNGKEINPLIGQLTDYEALEGAFDETTRDPMVAALWAMFGDIPIEYNDKHPDGALDCRWLGFPIGTERFEVWAWFDKNYSQGVQGLLFPDEKEAPVSSLADRANGAKEASVGLAQDTPERNFGEMDR